MYVGGLDSDSIGFRAGCSGTVVLNLVRAAGHTVRRPGKGSGRKLLLDEDTIIRRYNAGESGIDLAAAAGCVPSTVYNILRRNNVPLRDRQPRAAAEKARAARKLGEPPRGQKDFPD